MDREVYRIVVKEVSSSRFNKETHKIKIVFLSLKTARRSISAKHNNDNNKSNNSFSKSFSNTKKEELMKVINEAKQKLENVSVPSK